MPMVTLKEISEELVRVAKEHEVATQLLGTFQAKLYTEEKMRVEGEETISKLRNSLSEETRVRQALEEANADLENRLVMLEERLKKLENALLSVRHAVEDTVEPEGDIENATQKDEFLEEKSDKSLPERAASAAASGRVYKIDFLKARFPSSIPGFVGALLLTLSWLSILMATLVILARAGLYILPLGFGYVPWPSDEMKILIGYSFGGAFFLLFIVMHRGYPITSEPPVETEEQDSNASLSEDILGEMFDTEEPQP